MVPTRFSERELRELLLQTYLEFQQVDRQGGVLPRDDHTVIARNHRLFEFVGAVVLGLLIASSSVLVVFVVTRVILHLDFARYGLV